MAQDWDIKSRSEACTACSTAFEDGQSYLSALLFGENGYERADFCEGCWQQSEAVLSPYSSWQGIYRKPSATGNNDPLKKETAESLLRKLIEDEDPQNEGVIYILAVMLERKKILVEKDVTVDDLGTVHRVYEHRQTGETFLILDPQLKLDALEDVQTRVIEMLGGPLPRAAAAPTAPTAPTDATDQSHGEIEPVESVESVDSLDSDDDAPDEFDEDEFEDEEDKDEDDDDDDDY